MVQHEHARSRSIGCDQGQIALSRLKKCLQGHFAELAGLAVELSQIEDFRIHIRKLLA